MGSLNLTGSSDYKRTLLENVSLDLANEMGFNQRPQNNIAPCYSVYFFEKESKEIFYKRTLNPNTISRIKAKTVFGIWSDEMIDRLNQISNKKENTLEDNALLKYAFSRIYDESLTLTNFRKKNDSISYKLEALPSGTVRSVVFDPNNIDSLPILFDGRYDGKQNGFNLDVEYCNEFSYTCEPNESFTLQNFKEWFEKSDSKNSKN